MRSIAGIGSGFVGHAYYKEESIMGRGDIRTRKGKIFAKSFGKRRPHDRFAKHKGTATPATPSKKAPARAKP